MIVNKIQTNSVKAGRFSKTLLASFVLTVFAAMSTSSFALEVRDVQANKFDDRVELRLSFDQNLPDGIRSFLLGNPMRQVFDFPVRLTNTESQLYDGSSVGLPGVVLLHGDDFSRLMIPLPEDKQAHIAKSGRTILLRLGGEPFVGFAQSSSSVEPTVPPAQKGPTSVPDIAYSTPQQQAEPQQARPAPPAQPENKTQLAKVPETNSSAAGVLKDVRLLTIGADESLVFEFDQTPQVSESVLNNDVLKITVSNIFKTSSVSTQTGRLFSTLRANETANGLSLEVDLEDANHRVMLVGNRLVVAMKPFQAEEPSNFASNSSTVDSPSPLFQGVAKLIDQKVTEGVDTTTLELTFDRPINAQVESFALAKPPRQVLDFKANLSALNVSQLLGQTERLKGIEVVEDAEISRMILNLGDQYEVQQSAQADKLLIQIHGPKPFQSDSMSVAGAVKQDSSLSEILVNTKEAVEPLPNPQLVSLTSGVEDTGAELITLEFDSEKLQAKTTLVGNQLRLLVQGASYSDELGEEVSVKDGRYYGKASLQQASQSINLKLNLNGAKHKIRQQGKLLQVVISPDSTASQNLAYVPGGVRTNYGVPEATREFETAPQYYGQPISLNLKDVEIKKVMQLFADFTEMNLVLSDGVTGKVSVHLNDVPWDQALDIVMRSKGLVARHSGKVLLVSTAEEAKAQREQPSVTEITDELEPLVSRSFLISYQKTADLVAILKDESSNLLSRRGNVISDERTSQLFVEDTPRRVEKISALIAQLDKPVKQVMIEAKVVLADVSVAEELSVALNGGTITFNGEDPTLIGNIPINVGDKGFLDSRAGAQVTGAYTLLNENGTRFLNLQLRALEQNSRVKTVSNPRVITSNKEEAVIEQGTEIPYQVATSSGATATEFREANLKLQVTPQVAPDGSVLLTVEVSKDSVGQETAQGIAINTRRVQTKVSVLDGGTVVLGGIFEEIKGESSSKVPVLGDIPLLGGLFRGSANSTDETELLIFLTPVVMGEN